MNFSPETFISYGVLPGLAVAALLALVRLVRGPSLPDRVVALDLLATITIGFTAANSVVTGVAAYLDVAVILALIAFLGTVAFAYYLQRRRR